MMNRSEIKAAAYFGGKLGAIYSPAKTVFRLWQPFAEKAFVRLYDNNNRLLSEYEMIRRSAIFEYVAKGNFEGFFYTFLIVDRGKKTEFTDIYAVCVNDDGTRGQIADMRKNAPEGWKNDSFVKCGSIENAVIYELSVRDFSMDKSAGFSSPGKFSAFCEKNVANAFGEAVGMEYIKSLGATHIQLMPVFDFDFDGSGYNWGYNPRFYNAPCNCYSEENGILELRSLISEAHKNGIGVVADVVYNHTFSAGNSSFEKQLPGYFFRGRGEDYSNGSGCGNEFACERPMARKFILDSLEFLTREYHFDGFRFDLMGLMDIKTLRAIQRRLHGINPDILLYGEGWTGGKSVYPERFRGVLGNADKLEGFAFFNDSFRDGVKGSVFNHKDCGFVNGAADKIHTQSVKEAISGKFSSGFWTDNPCQTIYYVECHDNLTLYDKLKITLNDDTEKISDCDKMAAALVMLSRGAAFIAGGQEFLRSKNGSCNSYNEGDGVNSLKWNKITENSEIVEYYRGLIGFRKAFRNVFCGCQFKKCGGGLMTESNGFVLIINPTGKELCPGICGSFDVYIDENRASDKTIYTTERLCAAAHSVLAARKHKEQHNEKRN